MTLICAKELILFLNFYIAFTYTVSNFILKKVL